MRSPKRHRSGLALIELLASLTLLAALTTAVASWLQLMAAGTTVIDSETRFRQAARAVFERIQEDLHAFDLEDASDEGRVGAARGELRIVTRSSASSHPGNLEHRYVLNASTKELSREAWRGGQRLESRPLVSGVDVFECESVEGVLTLTIRFESKTAMSARMLLP